MSSALDEELCRLAALVAESTRVAVGPKQHCVERIVAAVQQQPPTGSRKRRLWVSPLDGAPPRARQRTTRDTDHPSSDTIMNNGSENLACNEEPSPQPAVDEETGGSSDDAVRRSLEIEHYQRMLDQCRNEDEKNKQENAKKIEAIRELRRVYLFGLLKVSKLQDLREAPDAIMPGNFVENNSTIEDESSETKRNDAVAK